MILEGLDMKGILFSIVIAAILTWVFATGNLPYLMPRDVRSVDALNDRYPKISNMTYKASHSALETVRSSVNLNIPLTHREQLVKLKEDLMNATARRIERIKRVRAEVALLCDTILKETRLGQ